MSFQNLDDKRTLLGKQLTLGYQKINSLNAKTRKVKAAQGFVMMKRDKIMRHVEEHVKSLVSSIDELKHRFEDDLKILVDEKIAELESEFDEIQDDVCMLMEICVESENTLKLGNENLLDKHSDALVTSFNMLFETDESIVDYDKMIVMDFKPHDLQNLMLRKGLGYVITSDSNTAPPLSPYMAYSFTQTEPVNHKDIGTQTSPDPNMARRQIPSSYVSQQAMNYNNMLLARPNYYPPYFPPGPNYFGHPAAAGITNPMNMNNNFDMVGRIPHPNSAAMPRYFYPPAATMNQIPLQAASYNQMQTSPPNQISPPRTNTNDIRPNENSPDSPVSTVTAKPKDYSEAILKKLASGGGERYRPLFSTDLSNPGTSLSTESGVQQMRRTELSGLNNTISSSPDLNTSHHSEQEISTKRPPRLPGAKTVDRLLNISSINAKIKTPLASTPICEDRGRSKSFSVRFSPTSTSEAINNSKTLDSSVASYMPKSIQELKDLQRTSFSQENKNPETKKPVKNYDKYNNGREKSDIELRMEQPWRNTENVSQQNSKKDDLPDVIIKKVDLPDVIIQKVEIMDLNSQQNKKSANESWDEECVIIDEPHSSRNTDGHDAQVIDLTKATHEASNNSTLYPSWKIHDDHGERKKAKMSDSGIAADICQRSDIWDSEIQTPNSNDWNESEENRYRTDTSDRIDRSKEAGVVKSINLSQFKSMFEKHIESNDHMPQTGQTRSSQRTSESSSCSKPKEIDKESSLSELVLSEPVIPEPVTPEPVIPEPARIPYFTVNRDIEIAISYTVGRPGTADPLNTDVLNFPIGININSEGAIIVNDTSSHLVKKFNKKILSSVMGAGDVQLQRPSAIVINNKNELFIKDDKAIHMFNSQGEHQYSFGGKRLHSPYGLVITEDDTLLVLDLPRGSPCLVEFNQSGDFIASHVYQPLLDRQQMMSKCRFMAYNNGQLLVSDLGRSEMYLTTRRGEIIRVFSRRGNGKGEFNEPSGITVDSNGNWIVADSRNNRLQVFSPNGDYMHVIKFKQPVIRPSDIHLTPDGILYIVDFLAHMVKVYNLNQAQQL